MTGLADGPGRPLQIWLDAQLPPTLAGWMHQEHGIDAVHLESMGLLASTDKDVFNAARTADSTVAILTKDADFQKLLQPAWSASSPRVDPDRKRFQSRAQRDHPASVARGRVPHRSARAACGNPSPVTLPNADLLVFMYVRKEAVLSSQIEGTQSSLQDLLAAEADLFEHDIPRDVHEVINYVDAMNQGLARLEELPVSVRLIREIHERLLRGVRGSRLTPGELRRSQNWIGPAGSGLSDAVFVPPPPHVVPEALGELESFLHRQDELPLLVKIGVAHAQFETIHPFLDGNGRVGRLLITFLLTEKGALERPVLYLSHYLRRHRSEYYERLQSVRDEGDWEGWLAFFLRGIAEVSAEATETTRKVLLLRERHRTEITQRLGRAAGNGHRVLEALFHRPIVSVAEVKELTGTSFAAANQLVARMADLGILREITGYSRNRRFRYEAYVRLFTDEQPADRG